MHPDQIEKFKEDKNAINDALRQHLSTKSSKLDKNLKAAKKHLPRKIRKSAETVIDAERRAKYQPFVQNSQTAAVHKARKEVTDYISNLDTKEERKIARRQWFAGLVLNYLVFLVLLAGFWYVATQL